jgi:hypothetical protein
MADVQFNNNADVIFQDTDDDAIWIHNVPSLTTQASTNLADTSFQGNATMTDHGGENASRRGFCFTYDIAGDPTIDDNVVYADGDFAAGAYFLEVAIAAGQSVRYRAYAVNNMGVGYGDTVQVVFIIVPDAFVSVSATGGPPLLGIIVNPLETEGAIQSSLLIQVTAGAFISISGLGTSLLCQLPAAILDSVSGLGGALLCQLSVDPLSSVSALEGAPLFQLSAAPLVSVSSLQASLLCQLVPDQLASVAGLDAIVFCQMNMYPGPFILQGLLSAAEALAFKNTEEFTLSYECTFNDLMLPIKSFSARFSTAQKSQVTVVIPNIGYADIIADSVIDNADSGQTILGRLSVFIVKTYKSGNQIRERISNVILEDVGYNEDVTIGAIKEITLSGTLDETWSVKTIPLSGASYRSVIGGYKSYRCSPDLYVRPGDTVIINGDTFIVNSITWFIDPDQESMTISEKAA